MSDGHSDAARYSKFYKADQEAKMKNEQSKIKKICLMLKDETIVSLDDVHLLFSAKYKEDLEQTSEDLLSENGSSKRALKDVILEMIRKGLM